MILKRNELKIGDKIWFPFGYHLIKGTVYEIRNKDIYIKCSLGIVLLDTDKWCRRKGFFDNLF